jgi:hypothetical protein
LALSATAPENGCRRDSFGDQAEDADDEKPQTEMPHAKDHRKKAVYP